MKLNEIVKLVNVADKLEKEELQEIGANALEGYEQDLATLNEWYSLNKEITKIANQDLEIKNTPFENASNIKFPLITKASIDFAARSYAELIRSDKIVNVKVKGKDPFFFKAERGRRVRSMMEFSLRESGWEQETDNLLHVVPITGMIFRKVYYDPITAKFISEFCKPEQVVVNNNTKSLEDARRVTHIIPMYRNDIITNIRAGLFRDIEVLDLYDMDDNKTSSKYDEFISGNSDSGDKDPVIEILEQHTYLDLDEDGYYEPYIITIHKDSGIVLRIVARFDEEDIKYNEKEEVKYIEAAHHFVEYKPLPSPEGCFYGFGLGKLLYATNNTINTLMNQLIDAGTFANNQSYVVGRGLRLKGGNFKLKLGECKILDYASGTDIKNNFLPIPTKEPSKVLLDLLMFLVNVGKDLASIQDVLQGKSQVQNVASQNITAMIDQGLKVFNSMQKRLFRSLTKEFKILYRLHQKYLSNSKYVKVLDDKKANVVQDFSYEDYDICPSGDPATSSDAQRLQKAQILVSIPGVDPYMASKYILEALEVSEEQMNLLLPPPNPNAPPPPELQKLQMDMQKIQNDIQAGAEERKMKLAEIELKQRQLDMQSQEMAARIQKMQADALVNIAKLENTSKSQDIEMLKTQLNSEIEVLKATLQQTADESKAAIESAKVDVMAKQKKPKN